MCGRRGSAVGRFGAQQGRLYKSRGYVRGPNGTMVPVRPPLLELFVQLPAGGGRVRELAVGSDKLTEHELIKIVRHALPSSS